MVIVKRKITAQNGRRPYPLAGHEITVKHFVERVTTPSNPFKPHKHEQPEMWYIVTGEASVSLDSIEYSVVDGDLIVIDPWVEHGLSTETSATWLCLG